MKRKGKGNKSSLCDTFLKESCEVDSDAIRCIFESCSWSRKIGRETICFDDDFIIGSAQCSEWFILRYLLRSDSYLWRTVDESKCRDISECSILRLESRHTR